jgi:hypothetical protein
MQNFSAFRRRILVPVGLTAASLASAQSTWRGDDGATPPGNGTLASPYASIQYAIDQPTTIDGDLVLVAPGTYAPFGPGAKSITVRTTLSRRLTCPSRSRFAACS